MSDDKIEKYLRLVRQTYAHSSNPIVENALRAQYPSPDVAMSGFYELVKNEPGTGEAESPAESWKEYWIRDGIPHGPQVNAWPTKCSVCDCPNSALHGAHVRDVSGFVSIVPLCAEHNNPNNQSRMLLKQGTKMVEAPRGG